MSLLGAIVASCLCGVLGLLVPRLIAAVPEPEPDLESESESDDLEPEPAQDVADKQLYVDIAAGPRLAPGSAAASAIVGVLIGAVVGLDWSLLFLVPLVPVGVALALIDWRTRLLPTWIIKRTYITLIPLVVIAALASGEPRLLLQRAAIGWAVLGGYYFLSWLVYPRGMGYGDVRLSGILGIALGYLGFGEIVIGAMSGLLLGAVGGVLLSVLKVVDRKHNPFGPWMLVGGVVGIVLGPVYAAWAWGNLAG
ncbi:MAG: peptidase prepilin type [Nocardioides sp.]|jgi:leader peptidase (prepilin peptidase)/N-methyltransferase|uniref:prepilin peptidase n=1 Tax=Nocardioides sp. TaxID=35761 RepID=UPI00261DF7E4|nr:A24 family peptidase [Nocardioides sp.]MCW2833869.1 peptidase prepilin type [Nocardioides sp.]